MTTDKLYLRHLHSFNDLIPTHEATRAAFVAAALEKNRKATPMVAEARDLKIKASHAKNPRDLLNIPDIRSALITAASVSDKAGGHFSTDDESAAIDVLIREFLEPAGAQFVEELVYRFLLTRGDSLGGSMRNWIGKVAEQRVARALVSSLTNAGIPFYWSDRTSKTWIKGTSENTGIEFTLNAISWMKNDQPRTLFFNIKVPFLGKNVDFSLIKCGHRDFYKKKVRDSPKNMPEMYVALGELKGGSDPAGGDEHWKTAGSALIRIRKSFTERGNPIKSFYIGAAIEKQMAEELWAELEAGSLDNAANLTNMDQLTSLCGWICSI